MSGKQKTAIISIAAAALLVTLKLVTGLLSGSLGLVSAAVESSGDLVTALLTLGAVRLAAQPADDEHHFGHERVENLSALAEALILAFGGTVVVVEALRRLSGTSSYQLQATLPVFLVLGVIVAIDVSRTVSSLRAARTHGSAALRANGFHFAADLAGSAAVIVGLALAAAGYGHADAIAALFIACLVFAAAGRLLLENVRSLMDKAPAGAESAARAEIDLISPTVEVRRIRVREAAGRHFADVIVGVSATAALAESHTLADQVEEAVLRALPGCDVVVHVEPSETGSLPVERVLAAALSVPGVREAHNVTLFEIDGRRQVTIHLKVPGNLSLAEGHAIGEQVEQVICERVPSVTLVQTHLEPLEGHVEGSLPPEAEVAPLADTVRAVAEAHGARIDSIHFLRGERGLVGFVTLGFDEELTVATAHERVSQIERRIHQRERRIRELVIHTEPSGKTAQSAADPAL